MISIKQKGDFSKTLSFINRAKTRDFMGIMNSYGDAGVKLLAQATPVDSGKTAQSWYYEIEKDRKITRLIFKNSNINNGCPIAIILQYGHGTRNGGWVEGRDYINSSIQPLFDELADKMWKEVTK